MHWRNFGEAPVLQTETYIFFLNFHYAEFFLNFHCAESFYYLEATMRVCLFLCKVYREVDCYFLCLARGCETLEEVELICEGEREILKKFQNNFWLRKFRGTKRAREVLLFLANGNYCFWDNTLAKQFVFIIVFCFFRFVHFWFVY